MKGNLTLPAFFAVIAFGVLGITQVLNIPLAIISIAGLVVLLTDRRIGIGLAAAGGCLLIAFLVGKEMLLVESVFLVIIPAVIISICIRLNKLPVFTVSMVVVPIVLLSILYFAQVGETQAYFDEIAPTLEEQFHEAYETLGISEKLGTTPDEYEQLTEDYLYFAGMIIRFLPALMLLIFTVIGVAAYMLAAYCFRREGRYLLAFPRIDSWKIDEKVLILLGVALTIVLISTGLIANIGENAALFSSSLMSFGGFSLLQSFMQRRKFSRLMKGVIYFCLVIFHIYSGVVLGILGIIDSHFDFRRLRAARIG